MAEAAVAIVPSAVAFAASFLAEFVAPVLVESVVFVPAKAVVGNSSSLAVCLPASFPLVSFAGSVFAFLRGAFLLRASSDFRLPVRQVVRILPGCFDSRIGTLREYGNRPVR